MFGFGNDRKSFYELKKDEAISKLRKIILDHVKVIEKSEKKYLK